ncbi:MAG: hypothetical protein AB8B51_02190 [Sedimentitalea sp.]
MSSASAVFGNGDLPAAFQVSQAGDFNGDGIADFVVGAPTAYTGNGIAYLIYGGEDGFPAINDLTTLDGEHGFEIASSQPESMLGFSVAAAGDLNGDGFDDLVVGAPNADGQYEYTYVRYDGYTRFYSSYITNTYTYTYTGYTTNGEAYTEQRTYTAGYTNFYSYYYGTAITYTYTGVRPETGSAYVIFGTDTAPANVDVDGFSPETLNIVGQTEADALGSAVTGVSDFNGDGIDDVAFGSADTADTGQGQVFILFGDDDSTAESIDTDALGSGVGVMLTTDQIDSGFGLVLSGGTDINGDGFGDIAVGAADAEGTYIYTYVRYDSYTRFYTSYVTNTYTYTYTGYTTNGETYTEQRTYTAGYANYITYNYGTGITYTYTAFGKVGQVYVFFGDDTSTAPAVAAEDLDGSNGFTFSGSFYDERVGHDVAMIGDVNGDGVDDVLIGAPGGNGPGRAYVVFGSNTVLPGEIDLVIPAELSASDLNSTLGFVVENDGIGVGLGRTVAGVGDVNGDGVDDFMVADSVFSQDVGRAHLVFGVAGTGLQSGFDIGDIDGSNGYTFVANGQGDTFAMSMSGADFDGDRWSDLILSGDVGAHVITGGPKVLRLLDGFDGTVDGVIDIASLDEPFQIGTSGDDIIDGNGFSAVQYGLRGDDVMRGGTKADEMVGGIGDDRMFGGGGADMLSGNGGVDTMRGGGGRDIISGGAGDDVVIGDTGNDVLKGGKNRDTLVGGDGDDRLIGGNGRDTLTDGSGFDFLRGGRGDDTFVFDLDGSLDVVLDFQAGRDVMDISAWSADPLDFDLSFGADGAATVVVGAETLRILSSDGSALSAVTLGVDDFIF